MENIRWEEINIFWCFCIRSTKMMCSFTKVLRSPEILCILLQQVCVHFQNVCVLSQKYCAPPHTFCWSIAYPPGKFVLVLYSFYKFRSRRSQNDCVQQRNLVCFQNICLLSNVFHTSEQIWVFSQKCCIPLKFAFKRFGFTRKINTSLLFALLQKLCLLSKHLHSVSCVPQRNSLFTFQTFAFSRKTLASPLESLCLLTESLKYKI